MKKVLLSIFAVAALTSCFQQDVLGTANGDAISFDNAFVDNATKAIDSSFNNNNLEEFQVYGTVTNSADEVANIFNGIPVVKGGAGVGAAWTYDAQYTQYWLAGNDYNFTAIVAGNESGETKVLVDGNGMPTAIEVEDAAAQNDVLFAQVGPVNYANNVEAVKFTFKHLLAKAKVSVKNVMDVANGNYYVVKDVRITNALKDATYTIGQGWGDYINTYDLAFGDIVAPDAQAADAAAIKLPKDVYGASNFERLLIPQKDCAITISVDYVLYQSGVNGGVDTDIEVVNDKTVSTVATIEAGKTYNFALTLGNPGEPITFDVEAVEDWKDGGSIYDVQTAKVTTPAELAAALADANVGAVVLMNDIELSSSITRNGEAAGATIAKDFILDGNGNTLTYTGSGDNARAIEISNAEDVVKNVTIKDLTINCTASYCQRGINYNDNGVLVLDNVEVKGTNVTYALNCPGKADGAKVTVKNSELTANIALNVWGENMWINVENSILTSVDNSTAEGYAAVSFNNDGATSAFGTVANFYGGKIEARDEKGELACAIRNAALAGVNLNDTEVIGTTRVPSVIAVYEGYNQFYSFDTLQEAINKVQKDKNGTLRLTADITLEEPVTVAKSESNFVVVLDLNGHTISGVDTTSKNYGLIQNNGKLTINGEGTLKVEATVNSGWNRYSAVISNNPGATLVINGGTIEHLGGTDMAYGIDNLTNGNIGDVNCTINGGLIKSPYRAVRQFLNSDSKENNLTVNGGVLEAPNKSIFFHDPSTKANKGKVTVAAEAKLKGDVYLFVTAGSTEWPVEVSIASAALDGESTVLSANTPAGYLVVEENGVWSIISGTAVAEGLLLLNDCYYVLSGEGFKNLATQVLNDGSKNVVAELANDIDLAGIEWPAVKVAAALDLDGKGHTIKNLSTSAVEDHGFYSTAMFTSTRKATTIKNLVVENATVTGKGGDNSHGAVLVACNYASLTISGVTVKNSTISNCDRTGGLLTYLYFTTATVENCVVEGCTINSIGTAGAILGMNNSHNFTMKGCQVVNTTVSSSEGSNKAGIFIGTWQNAGTLTSEDNTHSGSKAINAGTETNNEIGRHA